MADNIGYTPGTGAIVRCDDTGDGFLRQIMRLDMGADTSELLLRGGQQLMAASLPVAIASNQSAIPVSGPLTDAQLRASSIAVSFESSPTVNLGTIAGVATETTLAAMNSKLGTLGQATMANSAPVVIASNQSAIPISGTVSVSGSVAVTGPLTDTQLRATAVAVSGTFWQATQPVSGTITANAGSGTFAISAASLPLPTGAATEATIAGISNKTPALGIAAPAASSPVTLPNDVTVTGPAAQSAINTDLLTGTVSGWFDAANYHSGAIQVIGGTGITAGAVTFEWTNDTTAAPSGSIMPVDESAIVVNKNTVAAITIAASKAQMFTFPVLARYVRVRISTAFTGGTVQAVGVFSQLPYSANAIAALQATAGNLNATVSGTVTATVASTALAPSATVGGFTTFSSVVAAASTNATLVKASAGTVGGIIAHNNTAAVKYLKIFNKATAPVPGTDTPVMNIPLPANSLTSIQNAAGLRLATGIGFAITGGQALLDATAVTAGDVVLNIQYI